MPRRFRSTLTVEGVQTGDGRVLAVGAGYWEGLPLPYRWDREDDGGHLGAVVVGSIETIVRETDGDVARIVAEGFVDDEPGSDGAELIRLREQGMARGVSIDPDDFEVEIIDTTVEETEPDGDGSADDDEFAALLAAAGDPDPGEDGEGVVLFTYNTGEVVERWTRYRIRAATVVDTAALIDCEWELVDDEPADESDEGEVGEEEAVAASGAHGTPGCCDTCTAARQRARTASAGGSAAIVPDRAPGAWFENPALDRLTPLTITREGRVFGHIAPWGQCHTGSPRGECVMTPRSATNYAYFRTGAYETGEGATIPVGRLTIGGGHADLHLSYRGAIEHYDNAANSRAYVAAGEDRFGVWVAGAMRPGSTARDVAELLAHPPSGDWRPIGSGLEMVAVHHVNSPGFPIARVASGQVVALVAAGSQFMERVRRVEARAGGRGLVSELSRRVARLEAERERAAAPHRDRLRRLAAEGHRERLRQLVG